MALRKLIGDVSRDKRLWIASQLIGRTIGSFDDLTLQDWRKVRNAAYPDWPQNDWTVGDAFRRELAHLGSQYDETVTGQMRLF